MMMMMMMVVMMKHREKQVLSDGNLWFLIVYKGVELLRFVYLTYRRRR